MHDGAGARNPMPVTICAAMRAGSAPGSASRYDISVKAAEPTAIKMFVRRPAGFCWTSRSNEHGAERWRSAAGDQFEIGRAAWQLAARQRGQGTIHSRVRSAAHQSRYAMSFERHA